MIVAQRGRPALAHSNVYVSIVPFMNICYLCHVYFQILQNLLFAFRRRFIGRGWFLEDLYRRGGSNETQLIAEFS